MDYGDLNSVTHPKCIAFAIADQAVGVRVKTVVVIRQCGDRDQAFRRQLKSLDKQPDFLNPRNHARQRAANPMTQEFQ